MRSFLLHPKTTLTAMVTGLWSLAMSLFGTIIYMRPIESWPELIGIRPVILYIDLGLGLIAVGCVVLCAIGRSILVFVDDDGVKPPAIVLPTSGGANTDHPPPT